MSNPMSRKEIEERERQYIREGQKRFEFDMMAMIIFVVILGAIVVAIKWLFGLE